MDDSLTQITAILQSLDPETRAVIAKVIEIEKRHLYLSDPRDVDKELASVIKEIVK